jgi:hypothetical protein
VARHCFYGVAQEHKLGDVQKLSKQIQPGMSRLEAHMILGRPREMRANEWDWHPEVIRSNEPTTSLRW